MGFLLLLQRRLYPDHDIASPLSLLFSLAPPVFVIQSFAFDDELQSLQQRIRQIECKEKHGVRV
jgi:hypothetical protein